MTRWWVFGGGDGSIFITTFIIEMWKKKNFGCSLTTILYLAFFKNYLAIVNLYVLLWWDKDSKEVCKTHNGNILIQYLALSNYSFLNAF